MTAGPRSTPPSAASAADVDVSRPDGPVPTLAPLRVKAYRRIWGAAVVSHLGTFLQMTAAPWLMFELTGSPFLVSLVTAFLLLPRLLLTLPAGALADVVDRRTLLIVGNLVSGAAVTAMAILAAMDLLGPTLLLVLTLVLGSGTALAMPAFQTLIPDLVPRPLLPQAITLNSGAFNVARAVGPAIGGLLVAGGLVAFSFGANAVSFLFVVGVLLTFPRDDVDAVVGSRRHLLRATAIGVRYARFTPAIRILLVVTAGFTLTAASVQALLAPASEELGLGGLGYGVLWGCMGVGALVGVGTRERARLVLGARMVPGSIVLFGVGGIAVGLAPSPEVAGVGMLVAGVAWVWTLITLNATVQLLAPTWVRSRVVSIYALTVGLQPIGAFLSGLLAEEIGSGRSIAVATAITLVLGIWAVRLDLPVLGEVEEPEPVGVPSPAPHRAPGVPGGRVVVSTTYDVPEDRTEEFLALMRRVRSIRRRTGARRWQLHRDALEPTRFTEHVEHAAWDEHVAQHARLEAADLAVLEAVHGLDRTGRPRTRHLSPVDLAAGGVGRDRAPSFRRGGRPWPAARDRRSRPRR
ncbi:MFS transporter [Nitriliruptoraceae bacterium ZYF776]|nr:MFS transporter [Profundirhabdus halotolerans]